MEGLGPVSAREARVQTICLAVLATATFAFALHWLRPVLIPFVLALFIALALGMGVDLLVERARVPRAIALPLVLLLGLLGLAGTGTLVAVSVNELAAHRAEYGAQLGALVDRVMSSLPPALSDRAGKSLEQLREIPVSTVGSVLGGATNAVLGLLSNSLLVLVFVFFMLLGADAFSRTQRGTWGTIVHRVQAYLAGKLALAGVSSVGVWLTFAILGVPLAMVWALLTFLLCFVPTVGVLIALVLPLPVLLVTPQLSQTTLILALAIPGTIHFVANLFEPKVLGDSLGLHPITLMMALIFWTMLWGPAGALLAAPMTAVLMILLERFEGSRPLAQLLAGRIAGMRRAA